MPSPQMFPPFSSTQIPDPFSRKLYHLFYTALGCIVHAMLFVSISVSPDFVPCFCRRPQMQFDIMPLWYLSRVLSLSAPQKVANLAVVVCLCFRSKHVSWHY
ncbi:hypothetical protein EJ02DRAFT_199379 [Clathrospora elynae]|uniref:Uncharacterized protein n=1 Tax=Clathrospora elynae TaxID=706981 RepID=A0A6A5T2S7_9PLEO|nr:hypothetical protein EJ02DRAFT_199379 [Clathrospora elynae]